MLSPLQQTPENTKWDQIQDSRTNEMVFCKPGQKLKINNCRLSKHTRKGNSIKNHGSKIAWFLSAKVYDQAKLRHGVHEKWNMKRKACLWKPSYVKLSIYSYMEACVGEDIVLVTSTMISEETWHTSTGMFMASSYIWANTRGSMHY